MSKSIIIKALYTLVLSVFIISCNSTDNGGDQKLVLNESGYFESAGINYIVFSNFYDGYFGDSKLSGIEMIHHGIRTATNGDVRLSPTPAQWDDIPILVSRNIDPDGNFIEAELLYEDYDFSYKVRAVASGKNILFQVILDKPLPSSLEGLAGFNFEFLPAAYFKKSYILDEIRNFFPLYPSGPMEKRENGKIEPLPLAIGHTMVLAPEDAYSSITITSKIAELKLYDGRNQAQNGWFVVRSLIPSEQTGTVLEWELTANTIDNWKRTPVITHSQVGYHPDQLKKAVIELDSRSKIKSKAMLFKVLSDGDFQLTDQATVTNWGKYLRYNYLIYDFSEIEESGIYIIEYDGIRSDPFIIGEDVLKDAWQPTLDIYFPVQMDHMLVNEAYRVWHGAAHLDDALQAPVNHEHFDLYAQGPTTDTQYKPGEHIPGLNVGGWFDAGDYDIRTQTQYATVRGLVQIWEHFAIDRDQTLIDYPTRYVDLHVPDGSPDILQQIEHGAIGLIAQHRAVGHAIPGIIVSDLSQYTHLGDALTMTDNLIYDPGLNENSQDGYYSGKADDRWAFTSRSTSLNYGSAAALAASSRALKDVNPEFASECLKTAEKVWDEEHSKEPDLFHFGNTTGGRLEIEELNAAIELLQATGEQKYTERIRALYPVIERSFGSTAIQAVRALPYMDEEYKTKIEGLTTKYKEKLHSMGTKNPFGVPISTGGWAGSGRVIQHSVTNYYLHKAFPEIISPEDVYIGLNYIFGTHPGSSISLVSGVGGRSKQVAYGMNRADYSFIAGGIVPGVLILPPDFPENKEDWPFLWGENEYVISLGANYIFAVQAAIELQSKK